MMINDACTVSVLVTELDSCTNASSKQIEIYYHGEG